MEIKFIMAIFRRRIVRSVLLKIVSFFLCFVMPIPNLAVTAVSHEDDHSDICIFLEGNESEDGEIEIVACTSSQYGICAFFGKLLYDVDRMLFLGCEVGDIDLSFSYVDVGGEVRFLLDGVKNSEKDCILARFYFKRICRGNASFSISGACEDFALFIENGVISKLSPGLFGCMLEDKANGNKNDAVDQTFIPKLVKIDTFNRDGIKIIRFQVAVGKECFASGARLFIVDLESGETEFIYIVGVNRIDGFTGEYSMSSTKKVAVIITAVGYRREGEYWGDKRTEIFWTKKQIQDESEEPILRSTYFIY